MQNCRPRAKTLVLNHSQHTTITRGPCQMLKIEAATCRQGQAHQPMRKATCQMSLSFTAIECNIHID